MERLFWIAQRLKNLAETGIQFASNPYELDRNSESRALSLEMMALLTGHSLADLKLHVPLTTSYPTPKVDVRAIVFNDRNEMLMVQERVDGKWTPPGGWADPGFTPKEVAEKECMEEAGLKVEAHEVWAVIDKKGWGHPIPLHPTYKIFIFCVASSYDLKPGYEVLNARFFAQSLVPELSIERITQDQLTYLYDRKIKGGSSTLFN